MRGGDRDVNGLRGRACRLRRAAFAAAGLIVVGLLVTACGGGSSSPGVASAGSSTTSPASHSSPGSTTRAGALAYSRCMRSHGVPNFPDPDSQGRIQIQGSGSLADPNNPQIQAAMAACKSLLPSAGTPAQQRKDLAKALKFAHCMRSHGVPSFPDPTPAGSGHTSPSGSMPDSNSPQFRAATQACRSLAAGAGLSLQSGGGS
jgi:hypothetical protein